LLPFLAASSAMFTFASMDFIKDAILSDRS
jgi:hypothetical protein